MKSASQMISRDISENEHIAAKRKPHKLPVAVRMKFGDELFSMKVYEDGVSFKCTSPIPVGKTVELILCGGAIVVDAEVVECDAIIDSVGGFSIRTRYAQPSADVRALITEELSRQLQFEGVPYEY